MKTNRIFFVLILCASIISFGDNTVIAQISKGGTPPSFSQISMQDSVTTIQMPPVNVDSLIQNDTLSDFSFRFGYAIDANIGLHNSGTWDTLQNGDKIWRLKISSPGAFSINLIYDDFWLPEGAQFFVYNEDKSIVLGAFTSDVSNNSFNKFSTDLVKGDITVLEYFEPSYATDGRINVDKVIHAYVNTFSGHGQSGSCNVDVTCSQGSNWCVEKRSASLILVDNNTRWCSGCLINNAREDLTPYYLTANHCISGDPTTWIFRFKYWSPTCNQGDDATHWVSITGSTLRANHAATDFALLQLSTPPPSGFGVLYAGWDRTATPATSATAIHHPRGDVMKISIDNNTVINIPTQICWNPPTCNDITPANTHWRATFDQGIVQHGSSGSPLFNQNHRVIGQLHGNHNNQCSPSNNSCHCSQTPIGEYGRFDVSWNEGGTPQTRLRDWLDPDNTGATTIGPSSPTIYLINRTLTGTRKFAALDKIHIEGEVVTGHPFFGNTFCQTSGTPFTAEPGSNVEIEAKSIVIKPGTYFKAGSNVRITATNDIECSDNIVDGDYVNVFCNAQVSMKKAGGGLYNTNSNKKIKPTLNTKDIKPNERTNPNDLEIDNYEVVPNPANETFMVKGANNSVSQFSLYDSQNKLVQKNLFINVAYDLSAFNSGVYYLKIEAPSKIQFLKLVKL